MASQRFDNAGVNYLKCDYPGCQTLPAEFSDSAGGLNNAQTIGWQVDGLVLCPEHNPNYHAAAYSAFADWAKRLRGVNAKSSNL